MKCSSTKLAVLGGSPLNSSAIRCLIEHGYYVILFDMDPKAFCQSIASEFYSIDIKDHKKIIKVLRHKNIDGVLSTNDFGVPTAAEIVKEFNLTGPRPKVAKNFTNKINAKKIWKENGLPTSDYAFCSKNDADKIIKNWNIFPCVVKPSFAGGGSRGVKVVKDKKKLGEAVHNALNKSFSKEAFIEQFIEGQECQMEAVCVNGITTVISICDKYSFHENPCITRNEIFPGTIGWYGYKEKIEQITSDSNSVLGLRNGTSHYEVMINKEGEIFLHDVSARPGGGPNLSPIVEEVTGIVYPKLLADIACGKTPEFEVDLKATVGWRFFHGPLGKIRKIRGPNVTNENSGIIEYMLMRNIGDTITPLINDLDRVGYFIVKGTTYAEVSSLLDSLESEIRISVENV